MISAFPVVAFLRIEPLDGGWVLYCAQNDLVQIFFSSAEAERHARRQANALQHCGFAPRLAVQDKTGGVSRVKL